MKRTLALFLALALILAAGFGGCGEKEAEPLRICVDVDGGSSTRQIFDNLLNTIEGFGGPKDVEVEYIPEAQLESGSGSADRASAIKHLKTELMSGSGPDLFIVETYEGGFTIDESPMFPIPEQMLERRVFLPLDEYIEKARFAQWDKLTPKVMEAGRGSEGQMLVPLSYTVLLSCYEGTEFTHEISAGNTWQDMLSDESGMLRQAGHYNRPGSGLGDGTAETFTELADYGEEELLFTEEELLETVIEKLKLMEEYNNGDWEGLPDCLQSGMSLNFSPKNYRMGMDSLQGVSGENPMTIIPQYNREGGVTAKIRTFAAINRNSKRADDAFFVLDCLLGKDIMGHSDFYMKLTGEDRAMPMDTDMGRGENTFCRCRSLAPENLEQFDRIREAITAAGFTNVLDEHIRRAYVDAASLLWTEDGVIGISQCGDETMEEIGKVVKEACRVMDMELKES